MLFRSVPKLRESGPITKSQFHFDSTRVRFLLRQLVYSLKRHDRCDSKFSKYRNSLRFGNHSAFQAEGYLQFPELSVVRLIEYSSSRNSR